VAGLLIPSERVPPDSEHDPLMTWLRGTLAEAPWKRVEAFGPEVCVHTAWVTTPGAYLESPANFQFLEDSKTFLFRAAEMGVGHIVGLGTCIEYRITGARLSEETTEIAPTSTYARCKNELRLALEDAADARGFRCCWARVFYPYGPGEHPSRLCSSLIAKLSRDEPLELKTPDSTKDYIYIQDLAQAILAVVEKQFAGVINLGTGVGISVRQIARTLGELLGKPDLVRESPSPAPDPLGYVVADASRLHSLGWQPEHDLRHGLQQLLVSPLNRSSNG
jgi:nucleoside-diphosphate-sugar epimerase